MASVPSRFVPTPAEELLLVAALADGPRAIDAWRAWTAQHSGPNVPFEAWRLLPLVAWNLKRNGIDGDEFRAATAARRRAFVTTEIALHRAAPVLTALREQGVEPIVLKGAALGPLFYGDLSLRPMGDVDLLVRAEQVAPALAWLEGRGFVPRAPLRPERMRLLHAENLTDAAGVEIDLHWKLFPSRAHLEADPGWWDRSVALEVAGVPVRALGSADQLVHTFGHGLVWSPEPGARWIADAVTILRSGPPAVDADLFFDIVGSARMAPAVGEGLRTIERLLPGTVEPAWFDRLARLPVSRLDRIEYAIGMRRITYTVVGELPMYAIRYARHARPTIGERPTPMGFVRYLRDVWGAESIGAVGRRILRRGLERSLGHEPEAKRVAGTDGRIDSPAESASPIDKRQGTDA